MMTKQKRRKRLKGERGITLLEVMISMGVFTIGMAGLARLDMMTSKVGHSSRRVDQATTLGKDTLRHLSRLPFDHPVLTDSQGARGGSDLLDDAGVFGPNSTGGVPPGTSFDYQFVAGDPDMEPGATNSFEGFMMDCATPPCAEPHIDYNFDGTPDFQRFWRVSAHPNRPGELAAPAKDIVVYVMWRDPATGRMRKISLFTTIFNRTLVNAT